MEPGGSIDPEPSLTSTTTKPIGLLLLEKCGFSGQGGLGKNEQGIVAPISLNANDPTRHNGLGYEPPVKKAKVKPQLVDLPIGAEPKTDEERVTAYSRLPRTELGKRLAQLGVVVNPKDKLKPAELARMLMEAEKSNEPAAQQVTDEALLIQTARSVPELRQLCKERGLESKGGKKELIARLLGSRKVN